MYIRSKTVKGNVYWQVVEGFRDPADRSAVRQRVVLSLGREADPHKVLEDRRRTLRELERQQVRWGTDNPGIEHLSKAQLCHRSAVRHRIARLEAFVKLLAELIRQGLVGTTED
jgi:hypothetical protein